MPSCKTKPITVHADRELDLSRTIASRIDVPANALSARIIARRCDTTAWGGPLTVESPSGPLFTATTIADPGTNELTAIATIGIDELDGVKQLLILPPASGSGKVRMEAVFTVVDE